MRDCLVLAGPTDEICSPAAMDLLTEVERGRAAAFVRESDRRDFVAAHVLVRRCAAKVAGVPEDRLTLLQVCEHHGPGHGRPYIAEIPRLGVSLSHTRGYVCAAAGPGLVGVDAEQVPPGPLDESLAGQVLAPAERELVRGNEELIRLWTRKEALVKRGELTLDGLRTADLSALPLDLPPGGRHALRWQGRHLLEWRAGEDGREIAVCVVSDHPATLG
ncbi:4'-phosphopantetheinyl transferase [Planomonospora sphaerica]|uniref:4'-phosphopantetheinyl transferase n=3 Tax=Planomonospora TaxID=1998 RepID=A0A171B6B5_9ACTN|nr:MULTISPECIES: 4'-phosphopantetheinyl transferase superfamily protein [Planomonospora]GAT64708.1 4'-phosphopantetheinyl transferase [Planomonospora sphaerica]GGK48841.1 4'-phosphopantetheinyl transferase [Planomonospora parontospora]GII06753.1 4'-phosphopantetheinyl transferase [Planomonospora parontospora subsp. parontospora]